MQPSNRSYIPPTVIELPPWRYLFVAEYRDGTSFQQNAQDASDMDPKRTAFHDAMELAKQHGGFKRFHLTDNLNWYTVDLDDGIFEVNGLPFSACSQFINASQYDLTLIYAREKHELSGYVPEGTPASYYNRILIGWWFTAPDYIYVVDYETGARKRKYRKGEKVEQTIAIPLT